jgi:hypothetical protein
LAFICRGALALSKKLLELPSNAKLALQLRPFVEQLTL